MKGEDIILDEIKPLYNIIIVECKEGGYMGYLEEIPGVVTQAETKEDIVTKLREALRCYIIAEHLLSA